MANYQLYRNTTLGVTLQDTLDEMIAVNIYIYLFLVCLFSFLQQSALTEQAASKVLSEFDRSINLALDKRINKKVQFSVK